MTCFIDFTCDGKSETLLHAIGPCSQRYHGCHRGIANEMVCPNDTVFFPIRQRCVPPNKSEWCFAQKYAQRTSMPFPMKLVGTFHAFSASKNAACAYIDKSFSLTLILGYFVLNLF